MRRSTLLGSACLALFAAGGFAPAAMAATADETPQATAQLSEVVVTAERRTQSVQDSSLAISVFSADAAKDAGVALARDLTKLSPGVQIGQGGASTQIYIRGVGDFGSTPATNPAVATNVDGVYVSRSSAIEGNFHDLERIEILKGPQGTLYGRNASGGALNIITKAPQLGQFTNHLEAEIGNYNLVRVEGSTNIPLSDTLAVRGAFQVVSRDGYATQDFDDDHHESFRVSAFWKPTDRFSLRVTGDYTHIGGTGPAYYFKGPVSPQVMAVLQANGGTLPSDPRTSITDPRSAGAFYAAGLVAGLCIPTGVIPAASATQFGTLASGPQGFCPPGLNSLIRANDGKDGSTDNRFTNFSAQADYDLGFATLTVLPAYRRVRNAYTVFPSLPIDFPSEKSDSYSLETRLGGTNDKLTWVAGLYLYREDQEGHYSIYSWTLLGDNDIASKFRTDSVAAFGQATYSLTDTWRVIAGGRVTKDERTIEGSTLVYDTSLSLPFAAGQPCFLQASPCATTRYAGSKKWESFTYKVGTEYDLTPDNMLFLTWATGEKAGGFNEFAAVGTKALAYDPEKLGALEIGSRNRFLDSRLQVNAEAFYWKYRDSQVAFSTINSSGGPTIGIANAGRATMYGVDLDVAAKITPYDIVHVGVEYLHSNFDSFVYTTIGVSAQTTTCPITPLAGGNQSVNCSGRQLIRAPTWSGSASYTHTFELGNGATLDASVGAQFASSRYLNVPYTAADLAKSYVVADAFVTYRPEDRNWSVTGFVRNLNDALNYTGSISPPSLTPSFTSANLATPRTYGVRVSADF